MRMSSKEDGKKDAEVQSERISEANTNRVEDDGLLDRKSTEKSYACQNESSSDSGEFVSVRGNTMGGAYDSSGLLPSPDPCNSISPSVRGTNESNYEAESYLDFPALPVTNLFEENADDRKILRLHEDKCSTRRKLRYEDELMHSFQINNNADLVAESNSLPSNDVSLHSNSKNEISHPAVQESLSRSNDREYQAETVNSLRISDAPETLAKYATKPEGAASGEDRVSEWLWTLHRIGRHLNTYKSNSDNLILL